MLDPITTGIASIIGMLALLLAGVPVGLALGLAGFAGLVIGFGWEVAISQLYNLPYHVTAQYVFTTIPMFVLMRPSLHAEEPLVSRVVANVFPFHTPLGEIPLTWWVLAIVLGRELFMTLFRQAAARRGVVIGAIGPAKWKTTFQWIWVGTAYFWFFAATLAVRQHWEALPAWSGFANFNGLVGVLAMIGAVGLTLYSLALYLQRYGRVFLGAPVRGRS